MLGALLYATRWSFAIGTAEGDVALDDVDARLAVILLFIVVLAMGDLAFVNTVSVTAFGTFEVCHVLFAHSFLGCRAGSM